MIDKDDNYYPETKNEFDDDGSVRFTYNIPGATVRTQLAAMAMQGILSNPSLIDSDNWDWVTKQSVQVADALIAELNK